MATVAIPKRIRIRGEWWRVVRRARPASPAIGEADPEKLTIWLCPSLKGKELGEVFVHEVLHACLPGTYDPNAHEEKIVCLLEKPLHDLIARGVLAAGGE